jgi:hypothetical protein
MVTEKAGALLSIGGNMPRLVLIGMGTVKRFMNSMKAGIARLPSLARLLPTGREGGQAERRSGQG